MPGRINAEDLTNAIIDKAEAVDGKPLVLWDGLVPGLGLRIQPSGTKTWFVKYRVRGSRETKRYTIGPYGKLRGQVPLSAARDKAREVLARAGGGEDPQAEIQEAKAAPKFAKVAEEYLEKYAKLQKSSSRQDEQMLNADVIPAWGEQRVNEIRRRDVIELLERIRDRGAPIQANRVLALVRKLFNWAISRDIVEHNPCTAVTPVAKERESDRVLSEGEIRAVWRACDAEPSDLATMFRIHLLTGQRGGEVRAMRWADVDLDAGWWTIPATVAKNGLSHRVPLSAIAVDLLRQLGERPDGGGWVFPGRRRGKNPEDPIEHLAWVAAPLRRIQKASGVVFVPHDLRRTAASWMASLGVPRLTISKILNHAEGGVTRIYDRHSYDKEKREALDLWAERLMGIVG